MNSDQKLTALLTLGTLGVRKADSDKVCIYLNGTVQDLHLMKVFSAVSADSTKSNTERNTAYAAAYKPLTAEAATFNEAIDTLYTLATQPGTVIEQQKDWMGQSDTLYFLPDSKGEIFQLQNCRPY